jgi:branched-chain amino acid transport system ATP-binding protein
LGTPEPLLAVRDLTVRYGKSVALQDLSLSIREREVVTLLGANGAGKTTLLNTISGFLKPVSGGIQMRGEVIEQEPPHKVFRRGIVQVSQARDLFPSLSVIDNLTLGATNVPGPHDADLERVLGYFPRLAERKKQQVRTLSGGEQQMVAIGRALMGRPKILLLDEPSGGLAPRFVQEIGNIVNALKQAGSTMLLVEQNMALALGVADRFYILRAGTIVHQGGASELGSNYAALATEYYL